MSPFLLRQLRLTWGFFFLGGNFILKLDERKIRKGKPIGLPYLGSKKKISKKIIEIIKQNFGTDKIIYDVFGGGGAITAECLLNDLDVRYNDIDKTITDCFYKAVNSDNEYLKNLIISRDEFLKIRKKEKKTVDDELKLLINSFGNNRKGYIYGIEKADIKYTQAIEILNGGCYKEQLQRLEQLQQLQQLQQLERPKITNKDYKAFSNIEGAIFYLDPPYENTAGYDQKIKRKMDKSLYEKTREKLLKMEKGSHLIIDGFYCRLGEHKNNKNRMYYRDYIETFDSKSFYDWAYEMAKKNIVLISSYEISDPRFKVVFEFPKARSTIQGGYHKTKYEKLFMI